MYSGNFGSIGEIVGRGGSISSVGLEEGDGCPYIDAVVTNRLSRGELGTEEAVVRIDAGVLGALSYPLKSGIVSARSARSRRHCSGYGSSSMDGDTPGGAVCPGSDTAGKEVEAGQMG